MKTSNETILSIDLKKLEHNFNYFKSKINSTTKIIAVVKAFAYGHGDIKIANKLEKLGIYALWVTDFEEGVILRQSGVKGKIIVANPGIKSYEKIIKYNLDVVLYNKKLLNLYSSRKNKVNIHVKFNTGMNRYGFEEDEINLIVKEVQKNTHLKLISICSHLASSDKINQNNFTEKQCVKFKRISINSIIKKEVPKHILNSQGVINFPEYQMDMVRLGIGLYGSANDANLIPISSLKSIITQQRAIKKGDVVGYSESFIAKKNMQIAMVPVGYADGLNRRLSNGIGSVIINGKLCPIIGKISMGNFIADITGIIAKEGDTVEIFGENLSVTSIATKINTIPYEIYSTLNRRLKRIYSDRILE